MQNKKNKNIKVTSASIAELMPTFMKLDFVKFKNRLCSWKAYNTVKFLALQIPGTHDLLWSSP